MIFRRTFMRYGILLFFFYFLTANSLNQSLNNFSINLFKEINHNEDKNILISPLSVSYALMMVNKGASDNTSNNILSTLNIKRDDINNHYSLIQKYSNNLSKRNLSIGNAVWIQEDECYLPNANYISFVDSVFKGQAFYVDFSNNTLKIIEDINNWAFKATNGMIDGIVSENDIKRTTVQALLNTVYFKASWLAPFDSTETKLDYFNLDNDNKKEIYMMNKSNRYPYYFNADFQLLDLQYANNNISMFIFLPHDNNLNSLIENFNALKLKEAIDSLKVKPGYVSIPMFKSESSYSLKKHLKSMGMDVPFSPNLASFDGFWNYNENCFESNPKHYIDLINHKASIDLDENGVEAAAATVVIMNRITSISPFIEPFNFKANKPFLYLIYDKEYENIIFIGKYMGL